MDPMTVGGFGRGFDPTHLTDVKVRGAATITFTKTRATGIAILKPEHVALV